jgi:uncharacterized protein
VVLLQAPPQGKAGRRRCRRSDCSGEEGEALSGSGTSAEPIRQTIQGYGDGAFTVSNQRYVGAIAILPFHTQAWDAPGDPAQLSDVHLKPIFDELDAIADGVEIVLLGWGKGGALPPAALAPLRAKLKARGVSLDGMDTGAACRTFNLLVGESRRVAALLMPA